MLIVNRTDRAASPRAVHPRAARHPALGSGPSTDLVALLPLGVARQEPHRYGLASAFPEESRARGSGPSRLVPPTVRPRRRSRGCHTPGGRIDCVGAQSYLSCGESRLTTIDGLDQDVGHGVQWNFVPFVDLARSLDQPSWVQQIQITNLVGNVLSSCRGDSWSRSAFQEPAGWRCLRRPRRCRSGSRRPT